MYRIGTSGRRAGVAASALAAAAALIAVVLLGVVPATASAQAPAGPPFLGYNDAFNGYDLQTTKIDDPDYGLPILPLLPPILGLPLGQQEEQAGQPPPDRVANGRALMERAREGGAAVVRYVVPWSRVERDRGKYDWEVEDETYHLALQAGLRPLIVLHTAPCWAHGQIPCEQAAKQGYRSLAPAPQYAEDFGRWAAAAIERYPQAVGFEIWNESNFKTFWGPKPSPGAYVRLLQAVHDETADIGPHPPILFNGLTPKPHTLKYLKLAMLKKGAADLVDGTAVHPYVSNQGVAKVRKRIRGVRKVLKYAKAPHAVWITEIGWSTNPAAIGAVSDIAQASRIYQLVKIAPELNVKSVIVHRLRDVKHANPWEEGLGVTTTDNKPKPIFCVLGLQYGLQQRPAGC